ncbi:MAG TPA: hypothetical protein VFP70_09840 [Burkholderiales bacterium]|nr:hypothetical protein [Burkholderiales bacterium]
MSRLLVIATLGLGSAALPTRYEEACAAEVPERAAPDTGRRRAAPATAQERLSYLFWV